MRGADQPEGALEKFKEFFDSVSGLQARQLELAGQLAHVLTATGEDVDAPTAQLIRFCFREITSIPHDHASPHPAGQRLQQLAVINRSRGEVKRTEPAFFITLHV